MATQMKYWVGSIEGDAVVVCVDLCSSSDIYEQLLARGNEDRYVEFITMVKQWLAAKQDALPPDTRFLFYKFIGDGWILLFPAKVAANLFVDLLVELSRLVQSQLEGMLLQYLDSRPAITGLTFGIDSGMLKPIQILGNTEYIHRSITVASRLQGKVKESGSPAYKALVSVPVYHAYFQSAQNVTCVETTRTLRNIRAGAEFGCWEIDLLKPR